MLLIDFFDIFLRSWILETISGCCQSIKLESWGGADYYVHELLGSYGQVGMTNGKPSYGQINGIYFLYWLPIGEWTVWIYLGSRLSIKFHLSLISQFFLTFKNMFIYAHVGRIIHWQWVLSWGKICRWSCLPWTVWWYMGILVSMAWKMGRGLEIGGNMYRWWPNRGPGKKILVNFESGW